MREKPYNPEHVVIPQVDEIAVYTNENDDIVICQQDGIQDDHHVVVIPRQHLKAVIARLRTIEKAP